MLPMRNIATTAVLSLCFATSPVAAKDYAFALSPFMDQTAAKRNTASMIEFLSTLELGDTAWLLDGYNLTTLGHFEVPDNPAYNSPRAKANINREAIAGLMQFTKASRTPQGENEPSVHGALRLPQILRHIAENTLHGQNLDVILFGSPLYDDPAASAFSMAGNAFPSDGHLKVTRSKSPFGAAENPELLSDIRVHIAHGEFNTGMNERLRFFIQRFWTLYAEAQSGQLVSYSNDLSTVFSRARNNLPAPAHNYSPDDLDKLEIIQLRTEQVREPIVERPLGSTRLTEEQLRRARDVEVNIRWDCKSCDLDLYARPSPSAEVLSFYNVRTDQGEHWKDYTISPVVKNGSETITFNVPLELRALQLAVNLYQGTIPEGVDGEIRLAVEGQTYAMPFHINATTGNNGKGAIEAIERGQVRSPHTLLIDPLHIIAAR